MSRFDRLGWNEVAIPIDVDPQVDVVPNTDPLVRIIVRRIRGTALAEFALRNGSTLLETVPAGSVDIPGLELRTNYGAALTAFASGVSDIGDVKVQYAFDRRISAGTPS